MLLEHEVAGIVFVSGLHADTTAEQGALPPAAQPGMPIVLVNGFCRGVDAPFVSTDDAAAARPRRPHLVSLGHRRIGLVIGPGAVRRRRAARSPGTGPRWPERHARRDRSTDRACRCSGRGRPGGRAAAAGPRRDRRSSAARDLMALGAIRGGPAPRAVGAGRRVGGRLRRLAADRVHRPAADHGAPAGAAMAQAAVRALLDEINGTPASRTELKFHPELIVRGSTGRRTRPDLGSL